MIIKLLFLALILYVDVECIARLRQMRKWEEVDAQIKDLVDHNDGESSTSPVISYEYRGRQYISYKKSEQMFRENALRDVIRIYINPKNPSDFIIENWATTAMTILITSAIAIFLVKEIVVPIFY